LARAQARICHEFGPASRVTTLHRDTILRLLVLAGERCIALAPMIETIIKVRDGRPDPRHISTSYVERQNLTIRMAIRRFTRLTNAFSKKLDNHKAACALHFAYYNFCRIHKSLRLTPAMEAGITDHVWSLKELLS
jgi:hypothetical protein